MNYDNVSVCVWTSLSCLHFPWMQVERLQVNLAGWSSFSTCFFFISFVKLQLDGAVLHTLTDEINFWNLFDVDDDVTQPLRITYITLFFMSVFIQGIWGIHPLLDPFGGKNSCSTTYALIWCVFPLFLFALTNWGFCFQTRNLHIIKCKDTAWNLYAFGIRSL